MGKQNFNKPDAHEDEEQREDDGAETQGKKRVRNKLKLNKFHQIKRAKKEKENTKKKLRSLKRLLNKEDLNESVKETKSKEIEDLEQRIENEGKKKRKNQRKEFFLEKKYKNVKFTELKKLERATKKNNKLIAELRSSGASKEELDEALRARDDLTRKLNYVRHFPKNLKYISLFPPEGLSEKCKEMQEKIIEEIHEKMKSRIEAPIKAFERQNQEPIVQSVPLNRRQKGDAFFLPDGADVSGEIKKRVVDKKGTIIKDKNGAVV